MSDPIISHTVPIHLTATSGGALSDATLLEETSKVELTPTAEVVERKLLNSDGFSKQLAVWKSASGSLDYKVIPGSSTQALIVPGGTAFLTVVTDPDATAEEVKGTRYEIVFEQVPASYEAGALLGGTATFKVNGAPTNVMGTGS